MGFGETIKELRKQRRMTQREFAEGLNVNFTYISKIENDKLEVLPSEDLIRRMAKLLGTDAEELLDLAGKLDLRQLQQVAMDIPEMGVLLRRIQSGKLTVEQRREIDQILHDRGQKDG